MAWGLLSSENGWPSENSGKAEHRYFAHWQSCLLSRIGQTFEAVIIWIMKIPA
jgi:hypothetical protein